MRRLAVSVLALALLAASARRTAASFPEMAPNDPRYAADICPPATDCFGPTGQWNLLGFNDDVPTTSGASGISADLAWRVTTGGPDAVIAILDSGVDYDHEDLRDKIWLNRGELPPPAGPCCTAPIEDPWDCNADGVFNVQDYACDARVSDTNGSGALDRGDLRVFANHLDDDGNGYVDDLSGWDADDDDGDEFDHRFYGHGTGRAGIAAAAADNGRGIAGVCPDCPLMNVRIEDTFVCTSEGVAKGALYAVDNGAQVISMSLGCLTSSRLLRGAFDYATRHNVLAVNASANEFSFHHNVPAVLDDVMTIGAVTADSRSSTRTWLQKASFANYGAHLDVVAPTDVPSTEMGRNGPEPDHANYSTTASGTSSSTPHAAGVAGLVFARAHALIAAGLLPVERLALRDISAQEVRQIIDRTADDVTPADPTTYPVSVGWDKWTGYGRINARAAVDRVAATTIPPEADIDAPDWYTLVDGTVSVRFYANARWASRFAYTLEVGQGVEPAAFTPLAGGSAASDPALSSANGVDDFTAAWDTSGLGDGLYTLRLRVTDDLGNLGEDRMAVWVRHPDPQDRPGFPRVFDGSLESLSIALVDLDDDNRLEIVFGGGNGEVHAIRDDGTELAGFPVHTDLPRHLPLATSPAFDGDPANGEVPLSWASINGGVAVADLDRDGMQEIVAAASDGQVYCWHADGTVCAGFPVSTDHGTSRDPYPPHAQVPNASRGEGIGATPALGDLDGDGRLEIVVGDAAQKLYVWHADGTRMAPFPIAVFDPSTVSGVDEFAPRAIASSAAIADLDGDGTNEIVVGTNETYGPSIGGSGRAYVIRANGTIAPGWPVKPTSLQVSAVPLVAEGVSTSPIVADVDGDGKKEVALSPFFGDAAVYRADGTKLVTMQGAPFGATGAGGDLDEATPEGGLARASDQPSHYYTSHAAFADLDGDGKLDYLAGSLGNGIVFFIFGSGGRLTFDHLFSVWDAASGVQKPAFPRVVEDWQFFSGPAVADLDGDGRPEAVVTSAGFFVHAFDASGAEPAGWPKLTGQWQTATPSIGDLDGDGRVEVVETSRLGMLFVWSTAGPTCQPDQWRKARHDEWNTGTYGTDTRRPARIDDLRFRRAPRKAELDWTAVGDDGRCGRAARYELRAAAAPIDRTSFAAATPVEIAPPAAAGTAETRRFRLPAGAFFLALRATDEAGNAGPLASVGAFDVAHLRLSRSRGGSVHLGLVGSLPVVPAELGLPGADVGVELTSGGAAILSVTVRSSLLVAGPGGARLGFRDPSGTLAGGILRLSIGGNQRTSLVLGARLPSAAVRPGPFSVTLRIGRLAFPVSGTLRAIGGDLVYRPG
ncbi:MAG: hypothetical protein E6J79_07935 [Deltaproteobacteria bacterium]|nr:MAG: hypothetical protein E6J79_07935 [Deltaproteobacteria bacterium]